MPILGDNVYPRIHAEDEEDHSPPAWCPRACPSSIRSAVSSCFTLRGVCCRPGRLGAAATRCAAIELLRASVRLRCAVPPGVRRVRAAPWSRA